jgi:hypothetical protein
LVKVCACWIRSIAADRCRLGRRMKEDEREEFLIAST